MVGTPTPERIMVELPRAASARQHRELAAFAHHCVERIEKELGPHDRWAIRIANNSPIGYTSIVEVHHLGAVLGTSGTGSDGELATWDAMCRLEQLLRERHGSI